MIHVIDELHLNDFKEVHCLRGRDLFAKYGKRELPVFGSDEQIPMNMNKLDSLAYMDAYDKHMQYLESQKYSEQSEQHIQEESTIEDE